MTIEIGILITAAGVVIAFLGFSLNKAKAIKEDGQQNAVISTKLSNIERGVDSIRIDIRANEKRISELAEKFIRNDESLKAVHKRLDKLEGNR